MSSLNQISVQSWHATQLSALRNCMIQVIAYQPGKYTMQCSDGMQFEYWPPMSVFLAKKFTPIKPFVPAGKSTIIWKLSPTNRVSYNQIKKAVKAYRLIN